MTFIYNGNTPRTITYNVNNVSKLVYNNVIVWIQKYLATITGNTPITLTNATADNLNEAKIYGICTQNGTPTPSTPVNIACNNGVIKCSSNMCNVNSQTALVGYYISTQGVVTADINNWMYRDFIPVKPNTKYTLTMSSPVYFVSISEYSTANDSGFIIRKTGVTGSNTTLSITTGANTNYVRFGTNINRTTVTLDKVLAINWMLNIGNTMAYQPYVDSGIYTDGINEVLTMGGQTANVETLFSVGIYKDIQEIITGDITRKVGIKVFDGTETFTVSSSGAMITQIPGVSIGATNNPINTHFALETSPTSIAVGTQRFGANGSAIYSTNYYMKHTTITTVADFKQWLTDQYNARTPVIVIYPLATETTESVTSQILTAQQGTNTISSNKGAREMEIKYYTTNNSNN